MFFRLSQWLTLLALTSSLGACEEDPRTPGQLVVTVSTDMAMPDAIDTVRIQVDLKGMILRDEPFSVGNRMNDFHIPATLTLVEGEERGLPISVRVLGQKQAEWRTFREVVTTVPTAAVKELRMPVQWLCDKQVQTVSIPTPGGGTQTMTLSTCDAGQTCRAGSCMPNTLDSQTFPDYVAQNVFGASDDPEQGQCFDTVPCMSRGQVEEPDADCTVAKPDSPDINIALRVTNDGICEPSRANEPKTVCFVPLDNDPDEGWFEREDGRLKLPPAVCGRLKDRVAGAVYVSTECATKTPSLPPCGSWSSVPSTAKSVRPTTSSGGVDQDGLVPTVIHSLLSPGSRDSICCPLMSDGTMLYACVCSSSDPPGTTLMGVDPAIPMRSTVVAILADRNKSQQFSGNVFGGAFYWTDDRTLYRTPLPNPGRPATNASTPFSVEGAVYPTASLLNDANASYLLVSGIDGAMGSAVKVLKVDGNGMITRFETGADKGVYQFDQDDTSIYIASDSDSAKDPASGLYTRRSSVIRIDKASGANTVVLPERAVTIPSVERGGYVGVQADAPYVYALFEDTAGPDGTTHIEIQRVDVAAGSDPILIFQDTIDPTLTQLGLIGAVDGTLLISRVDYDKTTTPVSVKSSELRSLPVSGATKILASFAKDFVMDGLATGAGWVYWLNRTGKIYKLTRMSLR